MWGTRVPHQGIFHLSLAPVQDTPCSFIPLKNSLVLDGWDAPHKTFSSLLLPP